MKNKMPPQQSAEVIQARAKEGLSQLLDGVFRKGDISSIGELLRSRADLGQSDAQNALIKLLSSLAMGPRVVLNQTGEQNSAIIGNPTVNPPKHLDNEGESIPLAEPPPQQLEGTIAIEREVERITTKGEAKKKRKAKAIS